MEKENIAGSLVDEIERQVNEKIKALEMDFELHRDLLINEFKSEAEEETVVYLEQELSDLRNTVLQSESQSKWKVKKDLFVRRNELVDNLFASVTEELKAYSQTKEYVSWSKQALEDVLSTLDKNQTYQLSIKPSDKVTYEKLILTLDESIKLETDEDIFIGGFILSNPAKKLQVDKTLDYQIRVQKEWFFAHSGLDF
jgi:vacuolar-type H+-ATPase subunit E/Vma4